MPLSPSTRLGRYEVRSLIGAGGMGEVYLALDARLDRTVALKVLPSDVAADGERMRRFIQEAKAAAALSHPHIAHIYEVGEAEGTHFIAMEYIDGETLHAEIHREQAPLNKLLKYLAQVAEGLAKAHAAGIVHRDLKPDNIMITRDGHAKILDFGLAKLIALPKGFGSDAGSSEAATAILPQHSMPGMIMGTVGYMSPEQAQGRVKEIDQRSDIFSFGCILYEAATGRRAFAGKDALDSLHLIVHAPTPQIRDVNPDAPQDLQRIVRRCLAKEPDKRYQSIKDVAIELDEMRQELKGVAEVERSGQPTPGGVSASDSSTQADVKSAHQSAIGMTQHEGARPTSSAEYVTSEIKKHKSVSIVVLAILLLAVGGLGVWYFSNRLSNTSQIESIAVLPFVNQSGNADVEYLSDGITETLISSLSQIPKLNVKARSSVFRYKGKDTDAQTIGKELNVQAILNGRVVQREQDLTLYVELVDAQTENVLWKADYNRSMTNLVSLQNEIARDVSNKLRVKLSGADEQRLAKNYTANPEAYQLYLRGRFFWNKRSLKDSENSIPYFQQAIAADPSFALAFSGLADSYMTLAFFEGGAPAHEVMPKARDAVLKALTLDDRLAEAHATLGFILLVYDHNFAGSEREFKHAIELEPSYATAHQRYSQLLTSLGRHEESLAEMRRALEIDPLSVFANRAYGDRLISARRYNEAIVQLRKTLELDSNFSLAHSGLAYVYQAQGDYAASVREIARVYELTGRQEYAALARESFAKGGLRGYLRVMAERRALVWGYSRAVLHTALGEKDKAFEELNKSYENREYPLIYLKVDPRLDPLRDDPRFQDLLRRVGPPQ